MNDGMTDGMKFVLIWLFEILVDEFLLPGNDDINWSKWQVSQIKGRPIMFSEGSLFLFYMIDLELWILWTWKK